MRIPHGCHIRTQAPLELPPFDAPEPDGCIVRGDFDGYADRHPGPGDVLCVIEAADSSLLTDRRRKLRLYAEFGLPMYVILNLRDHVAEIHTNSANSAYGRSETLTAADILRLPTADGSVIEVKVGELLTAG